MNKSSARDNEAHPAPATDDHYAVLGVSPNADPLVISAAYKALIKKHHPDANGGRESVKAKRITQAFGVLGDVEARARYDAAFKARRAWPPYTQDTEGSPGTGSRRPADNQRAGAYHMSWHWENQPTNRGIKIIGIVCALAAGGVLLGLLLPGSDDESLARKTWTASPVAAPKAEVKMETASRQAAPNGWLVGSWVREDTPCGPATSITFRSDHSWSRADSAGTWAVEKNRLTLVTTSVSGAAPTKPDTRVKTILAIGPNEIKVASGSAGPPQAFDRCPAQS